MQGCRSSDQYLYYFEKDLEKLTNRARGALVLAEVDISVDGHAVHFFEGIFLALHVDRTVQELVES